MGRQKRKLAPNEERYPEKELNNMEANNIPDTDFKIKVI